VSAAFSAYRFAVLSSEIDVAERRWADAANHFRRTLDVKRRNFSSGVDPVLFIVDVTQGKASLDEHLELDPFCSYVETQLMPPEDNHKSVTRTD
jgi:hypothetical protein